MGSRRTALAAVLLAATVALGAAAPGSREASHRLMLRVLAAIALRAPEENPYLGQRQVREARRELAELADDAPLAARWNVLQRLGSAELYAGNFAAALAHRQALYDLIPRLGDALGETPRQRARFDLAMTHLRIGETANCATRYSAASCILPLRGAAIHADKAPSRQAIRYFTELLESPGADADLALEARWLLNLAYMTVGEYPDGVPERHRIPESAFASERPFPRFENVAPRLGLDTFSMSGGVIVDDFDGDADLDILVSDWHPTGQLRLFVNRGDGTFSEATEEAGLQGITGGLNMVQGDYDNDGDVDAYVLRGAWLDAAGKQPNSLLRNNGDATFSDVTFAAGLGRESFPTQTAAWGDYDLDGDLDLYVGNEWTATTPAPGQLFRNDGERGFTDVAAPAGVENLRYAKGVAWGDYDGDRWPDLYVSNLDAANRLYRNRGDGTFVDVAGKLGVEGPRASFPVWFWDFDNDGALDLYVASYPRSVAQVAAGYLGREIIAERAALYRGDGRGGFTEVAVERNLKKLHDVMGANFGDLDGDGYLDFYLGTGFPPFDAISPNTMYLNLAGKRFADVTTGGGFGHLQKGHAIAFADLDHDGDLDLFAEMGGAVPGDEFHNALYENPGFGHRWLTVRLVGRRSNRAAIGARLRLDVETAAGRRTVFRYVSSGGSFGASPLRQTVGLGDALRILALEVAWPASDTTQRFDGVPLDAAVEIHEGDDRLRFLELPAFALATHPESPERDRHRQEAHPARGQAPETAR